MITVNRLKEVLDYDPTTGIFTWKLNISSRAQKGFTAGTISGDGYLNICIDKNTYRAHRLVWLYCFEEWPEGNIDHINSNRLDNRLDNLRECTHITNSYNTSKHRDNTTGYKGVYYNKSNNNYRAQIRISGKTKSLGSFKTAEEASIAYTIAAKDLHKEFYKN